MTCAPKQRLSFFKRRDFAATVLDVSANGMLMDLPLEMKADPGDIVALSSGPKQDAVARVVHIVRDESWTNQWVGVEITEMSPEFAVSLNLLVTSVGVDEGWDHPEAAQTVGSVSGSVPSTLRKALRD